MKPILFNTEMVRAILKGRKTCTRRVIKPRQLRVLDSPFHKAHPEVSDKALLYKLCRTINTGDILYVRETWTKVLYVDTDGDTHYYKSMYYYAADGTPDITLLGDDQRIRWRPSIHMPKEAARIFLRVTDVRVERLREITEAGARAEGFYTFADVAEGKFKDAVNADLTARDAFAELWDSTIKKADLDKYGWEADPFVWVIEFERISEEEAYADA